MRPIFHLSFPVSDLSDAISFYTEELGAEIGRRTEVTADILLFGAQVTLHEDPSVAGEPTTRGRHFGATLDWKEWEAMVTRLNGTTRFIEPPTVSHEGDPIEQGKLMIADPSGNLVEIKAYRHPEEVLGPLVR